MHSGAPGNPAQIGPQAVRSTENAECAVVGHVRPAQRTHEFPCDFFNGFHVRCYSLGVPPARAVGRWKCGGPQSMSNGTAHGGLFFSSGRGRASLKTKTNAVQLLNGVKMAGKGTCLYLEKRARMAKDSLCTVCTRRSAMSHGAIGNDVQRTGDKCILLARSTSTRTPRNTAGEPPEAPRTRKRVVHLEMPDWNGRHVEAKYARGSRHTGYRRQGSRSPSTCSAAQACEAGCPCTDKAVLERLAGAPAPSLKGGRSTRTMRRAATTSGNAMLSFGKLMCPDNPVGALALGAKKLAATLPVPHSSASTTEGAAVERSSRSGAPATAARIRLATCDAMKRS